MAVISGPGVEEVVAGGVVGFPRLSGEADEGAEITPGEWLATGEGGTQIPVTAHLDVPHGDKILEGFHRDRGRAAEPSGVYNEVNARFPFQDLRHCCLKVCRVENVGADIMDPPGAAMRLHFFYVAPRRAGFDEVVELPIDPVHRQGRIGRSPLSNIDGPSARELLIAAFDHV